MLIRFVVENFLSFGERKEFNMLPNPRYTRMEHHEYLLNGINILKLASIYGANGAGKSNLIESINILKSIVLTESLPTRLKAKKFKFQEKDNKKPIVFAVEFINGGKPFYYGIEIQENFILTEELYESGLGVSEDKLIFERKSNQFGKNSISFFKEFEEKKDNTILKKIIENNLVKYNKPILRLLTNLNNPDLDIIKPAFDWFHSVLNVIKPDSKPQGLAHILDVDDEFKNYAKDLISSFQLGINEIYSERKTWNEFFREDDVPDVEEYINKLEESQSKRLPLRNRNSGEEVIMVKEGNEYIIKQLKLIHGNQGKNNIFDIDEESDGTIRLIDFIPAFRNVVQQQSIFIIDEIERSIHPLLIKELIKKFSMDSKTKGQLIFTTHESNLLDQDFIRKDEIWFAEKDQMGSTDLYSLSDFKEHNTIDIQKGYLNGKYGAIPFLGNLKDLNWHKNDIVEA